MKKHILFGIALTAGVCALTFAQAQTPAKPAADGKSGYYGNTVVTYSRTGQVLHFHYYPDGTYLSERPQGNTTGTWRINEKGESCNDQKTPPRSPSERCHHFEPGKKVGDSWDSVPTEASHHHVMIKGDVRLAPAPAGDPMAGYYDGTLVLKGDKNFNLRIFYNKDGSALTKRAGAPDAWSRWKLDGKDRICQTPWENPKAAPTCHPIALGKKAGDTWQHVSNGNTLTASLTKDRL